MALTEALRTGVLIGASARLDGLLASRVIHAGFDASLAPQQGALPRPLADLLQWRQFLTRSGALAFLDAPWTPVYIAVLWILHPALGVLALVFVGVQALLAWQGHHRTLAPAAAAGRSAAGRRPTCATSCGARKRSRRWA